MSSDVIVVISVVALVLLTLITGRVITPIVEKRGSKENPYIVALACWMFIIPVAWAIITSFVL